MKKFVIISVLTFVSVVCVAQTINSNNFQVGIPSENWVLSVDLKNFQLEKNTFDAESNSQYILATKKDIGMTISIFIEKANNKGNHIDCRSFYWEKASKSPLPIENLNLYEKENIAFVEYDVKVYQGQKIDFHSLNAYLSYEGYWVDVHISKTQYKKNDKKLFDAIVNSLKFEKATEKDIATIFLSASEAFYSENYKNAIIGYEQVLKTENIDKTMLWYITIDNLGMSYGISGDLNNAERVFEYGIKIDPEYPLFYYNLACVYAESSDLNNMLKNLELALQKKDNIIEGEEFPDIQEDSSFKKYLENEQFKQLLKKY